MSNDIHKPHIHVAAALIRKSGKWLITKRPKGGHLEGYWEFPGGKQERGENLKACLEREIDEELGLKIKAGHVLVTIDHEYETRKISLHILDCAILTGNPKAIECQEFRWIDPVDILNFKFPPPDIRIIEFLSHQGNLME